MEFHLERQPPPLRRARTWLLAALIGAGAAESGCSLTPRGVALVGTYQLGNATPANVIRVDTDERDSVRIEMFCFAGAPAFNSGTVNVVVRPQRNGVELRPSDSRPSCKLQFAFRKDSIEVKQEGVGFECGFGNSVVCTGTYWRVSDDKPQFVFAHPDEEGGEEDIDPSRGGGRWGVGLEQSTQVVKDEVFDWDGMTGFGMLFTGVQQGVVELAGGQATARTVPDTAPQQANDK